MYKYIYERVLKLSLDCDTKFLFTFCIDIKDKYF